MANKYSMTRLYLDKGGYDENGSYWGQGKPLYVADSEDRLSGTGDALFSDHNGQHAHWVIRARTREEAKAEVRKYDANATFYR